MFSAFSLKTVVVLNSDGTAVVWELNELTVTL